jgi:lactate dehydrogenase-like 2-hydroxyacid dehydrogenase
MQPHILVAIPLPPASLALLNDNFPVTYAPTSSDFARELATNGGRFAAVLTNGATGISAAAIEAMPALRIIVAIGAGYENLDLAAARRRGIALAHGRGTNDFCVADHAFALLLAAVRDIPRASGLTHAGRWSEARGPRPVIFRKRLGILGLGTIGLQIARRAAGFDMSIGYHNRRQRAEVPYQYFADVASLAAFADSLVIVCPGGEATRHLVNAPVLEALGPHGFLVNIARGSVVDTGALEAALRAGQIAGAALDVVEGEPVVPEGLRGLPNLVLTPHMGGQSPESVGATIRLAIENFKAHFAGDALLTPIEV